MQRRERRSSLLVGALALASAGFVLPRVGLAQPGGAGRAQGATPAAGGQGEAAATPPTASQEQLARDLFIRGDIAYQEGRYQAAIDLFREAYRLSPRPLLLYNMANAQERLGNIRDAVASLQEYLPHAGPETATVEARLGSLRERVATQEREERERTERERLEHERLERERAERERLERERQSQLATGGGSSGSGRGGASVSVPGVVLTVVGGAGLIAGLVFDGIALSESNTATADCVNTTDGRRLCPASARTGIEAARRDALIGDVTLGAGLAVLVAGVVVLAVDRPHAHSTEAPPAARPGASLTVTPLPGGGMAGLGLRF